jgi:hypothetical protein
MKTLARFQSLLLAGALLTVAPLLAQDGGTVIEKSAPAPPAPPAPPLPPVDSSPFDAPPAEQPPAEAQPRTEAPPVESNATASQPRVKSALDSTDEDLGFTWWNEVPELIRRGNKRFESSEFDRAQGLYQDASLMAPDSPISSFNLGLSRAKQGSHAEAIQSFTKALNLAGRGQLSEAEEASLRADSHYNLGNSYYAQARAALEEQGGTGKDRARELAIEALDSYTKAQSFRSDFEEAEFNKAQVQHMLKLLATPPPEQQPQDGGGDGDQQQQQQQQQNEDQQQQDQQDQQNQNQQQQQQQQQDQQQQQGQQNQDQQQLGNQEDQQEQQQGQSQEGQEPRPMTPEEARQFLNLLGQERNVMVRRGASAEKPPPQKDW